MGRNRPDRPNRIINPHFRNPSSGIYVSKN